MSHHAVGPRLASAVAFASAGLLVASCSSPAARPQASSSRPLPGASGATHAAPSFLPATTPASTASSAPAAPSPVADQPSAPAAPPSAQGSSPPASGRGPAPVPGCATAGLRVSIGPPGGAAGGSYFPLEFTNVSAAACIMDGYPGVSFVTGPGGSQLGAAAVRNPTFPPSVVTLPPGAAAHASLRVSSVATYSRPDCQPVTAHYLSVYPPGQFTPRYVTFTAQTCTGAIPGGSTLGIFVISPGATGP